MDKYKIVYRPIQLTYRYGEVAYEIAFNKELRRDTQGITRGLDAFEKWDKATGLKKILLGAIWGFKKAKPKL